MSVGFVTILSLSTDILLAVFSIALAVLLLWQDAARRSTQYFAMTMLIFALHGIVHAAWQVPQRFDLTPEPVLYLSTSLYIVGIILLFSFVCVFADLRQRVQALLIGLSSLMGVVFLVLIWSGAVYADLTPLESDSYSYHYTTVGLVGVGTLFGFILFTVAVLLAQPSLKARVLAGPLLLILLGAAFHVQSRTIQVSPFNSLALTLAVISLGYWVLRYRVYLPLIELNEELAQTVAELDRAMRRKAQFLANMSHELRTPLNSIIGYAELVVNRTYGELTPLQDDRLRKVIRNGHVLLDLINDVLDLTRIEAGRLNLRPDRVATNALLDSVIEQHAEAIREKGLTLLKSYGRLPALWVDEGRARQIVANLVSNAVKYTAQGVIIVRGYFDLGHHQVVISITDTGPGISPEKQAHLFNLYNQPEAPNHPRDGTGLGLALASQLTAMHGGKLWFDTEQGRGTTFHVALPVFEDSTEIRHPVLPRVRSEGPIILAIDDDRQAIEVLQDQLEPVGYRVYGAPTANDGLRLARELLPALITLDLGMPDLDGWQILDTLRGDPTTSAIPVLIISAHDCDQGQHQPADGYLCKPVDTEMLLAEVRAVTGSAPPTERARPAVPSMLRRQEEDAL